MKKDNWRMEGKGDIEGMEKEVEREREGERERERERNKQIE